MKLEDRIADLKKQLAKEVEDNAKNVKGLNAVIQDLDQQLTVERSKIAGFTLAMEIAIDAVVKAG